MLVALGAVMLAVKGLKWGGQFRLWTAEKYKSIGAAIEATRVSQVEALEKGKEAAVSLL